MPVRLAGRLDLSRGGRATDDGLEADWLAGYPALPPWRRVVVRPPNATILLDVCGSLPADFLATNDQGRFGVAGAIRLDRRDLLIARLSDASSSTVDPGLILLAYKRWGEGAFSRLEGDFSFVLWDHAARTFYLVRDAFGARRLHHAPFRGGVLFSSDVEGILAWPGVNRAPDEVTILDSLLGHYRTRERTFFRSIKRVLPRHYIRIGPSIQESVSYRECPVPSAVFSSLGEYAEAFRSALAQSVRDRIPRSGAVVCQLSAGLDSMSIASLSASHLSREGRLRDLVLANARFIGLENDEGPMVQELTRWLRVPAYEWDGRRSGTSDLQHSRLAWPLGSSSIGGSYPGDMDLAERFGAEVLLSGLGGNQVALEEGFLRDAWREGRWRGYLCGLSQIARRRPWLWGHRHFRRTLLEARRVARSGVLGVRAVGDASAEPPIPPWLGPRLREAWKELAAESERGTLDTPRTGSWMADAIWELAADDPALVWTIEQEDVRAAERGLEFFYPYLSWSLLELAISVPWKLRAPMIDNRQLQRLALVGVLPERLRLRNTFADFNEALLLNNQAAAPQIETILAEGLWASEGLVNRRMALDEFRRLAALVGEDYTVDRGESWRRIREVAALEAWLRRV